MRARSSRESRNDGPATTVTGPDATIPLATGIGRVDAEAELAVVIGCTATRLTLSNAAGHILGVTIANDVTARDLQQSDPLWFAATGFDGWTPLGPWIATGVDPADLSIGLRVNGVDLTPASTADLARSVMECLVYVTSVLTLHPGDVVQTGAPGGTGAITVGSTVTATIGEMMGMFMATSPGPLHRVRGYELALAGAEANVATGLARLGHRVGWVGKVGAGDGFAAGLISAHLDGLGPEAALARASAVGALATTSPGDKDGLPTRSALDAFLAAARPHCEPTRRKGPVSAWNCR